MEFQPNHNDRNESRRSHNHARGLFADSLVPRLVLLSAAAHRLGTATQHVDAVPVGINVGALRPVRHHTVRTDDVGHRVGGGPYAVLQDTPALKAPYDNAIRTGTFHREDHKVSLYCWKVGTSYTGKRGNTDVWFNEGSGNWISEADVDTGQAKPPVPECGSSETASATEGEITDFVTDNTGKTLTSWSGDSPGQCGAVIDNFLNHYYGVVLTGNTPAYSFVPGGRGATQIKAANFTWHTDRNFKDGDILVMDRDSDMQYGHVALYYRGKIFESNVGGRMTAQLDPVNLPNYRGYWRA